MKKWASVALTTGLLAIFVFPDRSESQQIGVAYAAIAGSQVPIWMLKESGRLKPAGVDMEKVGGRSTTE